MAWCDQMTGTRAGRLAVALAFVAGLALGVSFLDPRMSAEAQFARGPSATPKVGRTYRATFNAAPAPGPSAVFLEILGPTTGVCEVVEIFMGDPSAAVTVTANRRSTATTGGTSTNRTLVRARQTEGAATSTVRQFSVAPTAGTLIGEVLRDDLGTSDKVTWTFGDSFDTPIILTGAADVLTLELNVGASVEGHVVIVEMN